MSSCNPCDDNISIILDTGSQGPQGPVGPIADVFNYEFVLLAGDTIISGTDNSGKDFTYNPNSLQVHINGVLLSAADYTATDGASIVLNEAAANNNDLAQISTQVKPEGSDDIPSEIDRIDGEIADLDARVTTNEGNIQDNADAIEAMQNKAATFTTEDVKVAGTVLLRDRGDDLETQKDINHLFDADILANASRIDALETKEPEVKPDDLDGIKEDVAENSQGISDNAQAISDLVDVVEINSTDIEGLQGQIDKLPPPTDISELEQDVDDIAKQVGSNTIAIAKNTADIAALPEMTIDLDPLNDAIADNAAGVAKNASDILGLKATDAKHTGEIGDLQTAVGHLEAIDIPDNYAVVDDDNEFQVPQTIKDGIRLTGADAFIEADTGTPVSFKNNNFSNPVINVMRSNGDVAISLEASGHIRKLATDPTDPTSAVNVEFVTDLVGDNEHTHDTYATKVELKTEEQARILADQALDAKIDALEPYDDAGIKRSLANEEAARIAGDSALNDKIESLELGDTLPDDLVNEDGLAEALEPYATKEYVTNAIDDIEIPSIDGLATEEYVDEGDAATLEAAKHFTESEMIGVATEDFVSAAIENAGEFITESYTQAIADQAEIQAEKDAEQDAEMNMIEGRLAAVESVTIDGVWELDLQLAIPRPGEFVLLKSQSEVAATFDEVTLLIFNEESKMGVIDFSAVTTDDVFRIATAQDEDAPAGRLSESLAEFKVTEILAPASYRVTLIRSNGTPQDSTDYGARLLSSFDPDGLATLDGTIALVEKAEENANNYTDAQIAAADYLPTTGGDITGKVIFKDGAYIDAQVNNCAHGRGSFNIRVNADRPMLLESGSSYKAVLQTLAYQDQGGTNGDRALSPFVLFANGNIDTRNIRATGQVKVEDAEFKVERDGENVFRVTDSTVIAKLPVTSHERVTVNDGIMLGGGEKAQNIYAKYGHAGYLVYNSTGDWEDDVRMAWGNNTCWFYKQVDMQQNKIIGCGNADMTRGKDVVNVNTLNAALADVGEGDAVLAANQTFTGINTFTSEIRSESNTVMEFKGDPNNFQDRHIKVRRGISYNLYAYSGQDNNGAKKVFHCKWAKDDSNPEFWVNYIPDPTQNGNPVNLRYANATYAKKTDVANVPDATSTIKGITYLGQAMVGTSVTPSLKQGQLYFNRSKNRLYIGT